MLKIGILCPGDDELEPFLPCIENCRVTEKAMLKFYQGELQGMSVVALYSGVCKVNAAIAAQLLIDTFHADVIINAGTAGGMDETIEIFDTIICTKSVYHDVDDGILTEFHPWLSSVYFDSDSKLLGIAEKVAKGKPKVHFGKMVTGEKFISDDLRFGINARYSPLSVDMETASIAHVCYVYHVPFIAIRTITDTALHSGILNFEINCKQASVISKDFVLEFLQEVKGTLNLS